jgi:hypothetical protein
MQGRNAGIGHLRTLTVDAFAIDQEFICRSASRSLTAVPETLALSASRRK